MKYFLLDSFEYRYCWKGKVKKLQKYLDDPKSNFDVNMQDHRGRSALHMASSWGCIRTLRLLLTVPGIKLDLRDAHGKTPLYKVRSSSFSELMN